MKGLDRLKQWARRLRRDVMALFLAGRDPRVPLGAKLLAAATAAYALSPIDLIPDFIPVLGYLDDLVLVPLAIALCVRLIPGPVMADLRTRAVDRMAEGKRSGAIVTAVIVSVWVGLGAALAGAVMPWGGSG